MNLKAVECYKGVYWMFLIISLGIMFWMANGQLINLLLEH